ncbi:MAG: cobyric acid synthase CobQ [Bacteroidetes bacterium]|nr:cobyric acid synthase CobQ [Bacteroidota bacterium]
MIDPRIKYYPVDNGDTSLITLSDETKILIDINITEDSQDEENKDRFDVFDDLLNNELKKDNGIPYTDVFILTHPDVDHCRGFEKCFYHGNPNDYDEDDKKDNQILIKELWYTPKVFSRYSNDLSQDAKVFKKEAKRRMELYKSDPNEADNDGNRIRIVGYTDNDDLKGLHDRLVVPGETINVFNDIEKDDFKLFIHAPLKKRSDDEDKNDSSIVFQAKFDVDNEKNACLAFWGGDACWRVWEDILDKSKDEDLNWDLFLAPHHCSWGFFNENTDEGKKEPKQSSLDVLDKKIGEFPKVIVSSKEIKNDDVNPPSYKARNQYVNRVKEKNFHVTSTDSGKTPPEPIEFEISSNGPSKSSRSSSNKALKTSLITKAASQPKTYGRTL